jgi:hypothetical protein
MKVYASQKSFKVIGAAFLDCKRDLTIMHRFIHNFWPEFNSAPLLKRVNFAGTADFKFATFLKTNFEKVTSQMRILNPVRWTVIAAPPSRNA